MINPRTEQIVAVIAAVFALNGLFAIWGSIGLFGPILLALIVAFLVTWAVAIGKNMKELEYEQNRSNKKKRNY